jgi:DNA-binding CsgD family transcriptional regulator
VSVRTDITEQIKTQHDLDLTRKLLEEEREFLKSKNSALNELLNHLDQEKKKVLSAMASNLEIAIFPLLDRMLEQDSPLKKQLEILKKNLHEIADPLIRKAQEVSESLTPKELQICNLIRQGLAIKEIASLMHLSPRTIDKHRENIRKKLNITERKTNLGAYLSSHL